MGMDGTGRRNPSRHEKGSAKELYDPDRVYDPDLLYDDPDLADDVVVEEDYYRYCAEKLELAAKRGAVVGYLVRFHQRLLLSEKRPATLHVAVMLLDRYLVKKESREDTSGGIGDGFSFSKQFGTMPISSAAQDAAFADDSDLQQHTPVPEDGEPTRGRRSAAG